MQEWLYRFFVEPRLTTEGVVFQGIHLVYLISVILFITVSTLVMKNQPIHRRHRFINILFILSITLEVLKRIRFFLVGLYFDQPLFENIMFLIPYHICYINVILLPIVYYKKITWAQEFVYIMSILGAFIAFLYPYDWFNEPFLKYEIIHEMVYHVPLFLIPFFLIVSGEYRPRWQKVWQVALGCILCLPLAELGNTIFQNPSFNFMFTRTNPLPLNLFPGAHHLWTFAVLFLVVMILFYGTYELTLWFHRKSLRKKTT